MFDKKTFIKALQYLIKNYGIVKNKDLAKHLNMFRVRSAKILRFIECLGIGSVYNKPVVIFVPISKQLLIHTKDRYKKYKSNFTVQ